MIPATANRQEEPHVVWSPLPGSQTLAIGCPADIILFHGTRGPGKTDWQLMKFRQGVGQGYGRFWRGIIFDREYKNLDDLISKSMRWFPEFDDGARFISSKSDYKWVWPTGEELLFRAIKKEKDYWGYHGQEFPYIGWNELTKYPTGELFEMMMSCNRTSFLPEKYPVTPDGTPWKPGSRQEKILLPDIHLQVTATCNPYGAGHNWVKKKFINKSPRGKILRTSINVFNPRTQQREDIVKTQVHIFGSYRENKYLTPEYVAELETLTDKNKREAWLYGNWDIVAGGMFDDVWDSLHHVVKPFTIPNSWRIERAFDWGSSAPFSVGWWAVSDGTDFQTADGTWRSSVRGDVYRIREWYGTSGKTNSGLMMLAKDITAGIIERQLNWSIHNRTHPGPADNSINDVVNGNSIAADMAKSVRVKGSVYSGVRWRASDKSSGSRKAGWEKLRKMLSQALPTKEGGPRERPGLFVFDCCTYFIDLFPSLPRDEKDPDDVDTESEDHIGDETRYEVLGLNTGTKTGRTAGHV